MPLGVHGYTMYHCEKTKLRMADLWPTEQADTRETPYPFLSNLLTDSMEGHSHGKGFVVEHLSKKMRRMCGQGKDEEHTCAQFTQSLCNVLFKLGITSAALKLGSTVSRGLHQFCSYFESYKMRVW